MPLIFFYSTKTVNFGFKFTLIAITWCMYIYMFTNENFGEEIYKIANTATRTAIVSRIYIYIYNYSEVKL